MATQRVSIEAAGLDDSVIGHPFAQGEQHAFDRFSSLPVGVLESGDFEGRTLGAQAMAGVHEYISGIEDVLWTGQTSKSVCYVRRDVERVSGVRMFGAGEILVAHYAYMGPRTDAFFRENLAQDATPVARLAQQRK